MLEHIWAACESCATRSPSNKPRAPCQVSLSKTFIISFCVQGAAEAGTDVKLEPVRLLELVADLVHGLLSPDWPAWLRGTQVT